MDSRETLKYEHKQMKELVLNYERRQEEEDYQGMVHGYLSSINFFLEFCVTFFLHIHAAMIAETASNLHGKVKQPKKPAEPLVIKKSPSSPSNEAAQPTSRPTEGIQRAEIW